MPAGDFGYDQISNTDPLTGDWSRIQMLTDTVFAVLKDSQRTDHGNITALTFKAGLIIRGTYSAITLTSGAIFAYRRAK